MSSPGPAADAAAPSAVRGAVVTLAAPSGDLERELDGAVSLGVQVLEVDPAGVPLVRRHAPLLVHATAPDFTRDWRAALDTGPDLLSVPLQDIGPDLLVEAVALLRNRNVAPAYVVTEPAQIAMVPEPASAYWCLHLDRCPAFPGAPGALVDAVRMLPPGAVFTASGSGASALPVLLTALAGGGHVRVGPAAEAEYAPGEPARSGGQLAARAVGLAKIAQRPPMSVSDARTVLGVGTRD